MKITNKYYSHIRKKVEFTGKVASMTLDKYYWRNVNVKPYRYGFKRKMLRSKWHENFKRTHYFGPKYWVNSSPEYLEEVERFNDLQRQIRELNERIEYMLQAEAQQRILDQLKDELAKLDITKENGIPIEAPKPQQQHQYQREPLTIMFDDQIIYDEEYMHDSFWMETDEDSF